MTNEDRRDVVAMSFRRCPEESPRKGFGDGFTRRLYE